MNHLTNLAAAILAASLVSPAWGSSISVDIVPVDNSAVLTGYNTFDFQATTLEYDWGGASLLLELTAGSLYQDPGAGMFGGTLPIHPFFFQQFPAAEFDTSVGTLGGAAIGGSSSVGGDGNLEFSATRLNVSFYNFATTNIGTLPIGRITLSQDAVGTWRLLAVNGWGDTVDLVGTIDQGVIAIDTEASLLIYMDSPKYKRLHPPQFEREVFDVSSHFRPILPFPEIGEPDPAPTNSTLPEPGTVALLGLGAAALLRRRR